MIEHYPTNQITEEISAGLGGVTFLENVKVDEGFRAMGPDGEKGGNKGSSGPPGRSQKHQAEPAEPGQQDQPRGHIRTVALLNHDPSLFGAQLPQQ